MPPLRISYEASQVSAYHRMEVHQLPRMQGFCESKKTRKVEIRSRLGQENKEEKNLKPLRRLIRRARLTIL